MNRLPLTTSHAKRVSDAYSVVYGSLQPVIFTWFVLSLTGALLQNKISAWPSVCSQFSSQLLRNTWESYLQTFLSELISNTTLWPPVDLRNQMLCISKVDISIISNFIFSVRSHEEFGLSTMEWRQPSLSVAILCSKMGSDPDYIVSSL